MTPCQATTAAAACQETFRWDRSEQVDLLEQALHHPDHPSLLAFAAEHHIPPSTLRYWRRRRDQRDTSEPLRAFFESPAGLDFLQDLVLAAHLCFQQTGACGIRLLLRFFDCLPLKPFLARSYGCHQGLATQIQDLLLQYGQEQRQKLAPAMPARKLTLCEDENFHQGPPCLVAIEPASNFLLVEEICPRRDGDTWTQVVTTALDGLDVTVIQVTSDEASGILAHARDGLGAHHSPDLMHLQQDLHRATSLPLQRQAEQARQHAALAEARAAVEIVARIEHEEGPARPGRPPDFAGGIEAAKQALRQGREQEEECQRRQEEVRQAIRGLGDDYHPFTPEGQAHSPATLEAALGGRLGVIEEAAEQAGLSAAGKKKIAKVRKVLPALVATLAWFWTQVREVSAAGGWTEAQQELLRGPLLGWAYWQGASGRGRDAEQRRQLRQRAAACREAAEGDPAWQSSSAEQRQGLEEAAVECAGRWVRSSSCVEGRNGYLRLRHHGKRGLSKKGLGALTVLHNYWLVRPDGTTAAERFFGQKPDNLFDWLRQRLPQMPRPAKSRRNKAA